MENLLLSFNIVLPLFLCILLGYFLRRIRFFDDAVLKKMNACVFKVFLPIYLFNNVYTTDLSAAFNAKLMIFSVISVFVLFGLLMLVIPLLEKENPKRGVIIQAIFRSNFALFGLPLAISLCGEEKAGPTSLLVGFIIPIYNVLAVVVLEVFRGGKPDVKKILKGIVTNPLIIASLLGILINLTGFRIPTAVHKAVKDLGGVATPLSLVVLGGSFIFSHMKQYTKQILIGVGGKLIISPLIFVTAGILLGFRNEYLAPILIMFGAPAAVSSFTMAEQMGGDGELAGQLVVLTSAFSILTIFLWIFGLKQLGFL